MWLTFDDLRVPGGRAPLVAAIDDVPGVQSVRVNFAREGDIEGNSEPRKAAYGAAAAGALAGAAPGVEAHNKKDAATGAAMGAVTAFMVTSGLGEELNLQKGTKLEITLERPLYLAQD
jgi:outer membrane lipoprotein SlyB